MKLGHRRWALALALAPALAFGWGTGHDAVGRAVAARLPEPWRTSLQGETLKRFCADSHYPDSFEAFPVDRVGEASLVYLKAQGITKRHDLHSDQGRAVAFCMLVRGLRESQRDRALLWLACLAHSTADMAACNHDPVVHVATYGWCTKEWAMKLPSGKPLSEVVWCLDLGWVKDDAFGRHVDAALLRDTGSNAGAALLEIMLYGVRGAEACAPHGPAVLSAAAELADTGQPAAGERLASELSALGAWATGRILRDFQVALRLAEAGCLPDVTPDVRALYEAEMDACVKTRPLAVDRYAEQALAPSGVAGSRIGVLVEPCWRMDDGLFGFGDRMLAVQIVDTLRRHGKNAELVDVRQFLDRGAEAPTLIIPAQRCRTFRTLKVEALDKRLSSHLCAGGKVVWIGGGKPPAALCKAMPKDFLVRGADQSWPVPQAEFRAGALRGVGGEERMLVRSPDGPAGWHWPRNPFAFAPACAEIVRPLLTWRGAGEEHVVGAAWPKEHPTVAYLPTYAVAPYIWTQETPALAPLRLELDAAGANVLEAALEMWKTRR